MGKKEVQSITLTRAEGPSAECDKPQAVTGWQEADMVLKRWAETAPKDCQTYDKCDFTITYSDGETYTGRYDLKNWLCEFPDLGKHVRDFVTFHAGQRKPAWMSDEQYQRVMNMPHIQELKPEFERFLKDYEIPGVVS